MTEFFALLHPAIVHLPIGFIIIAIIADFVKPFHKVDSLLWGLAAISSIVAVISGLLLGNTGHYEDFSFFLHKWATISTAVITTIVWILKFRSTELPRYGYSTISILLFGLLGFAGHKGADLTHGKNYLPLGDATYITADINAEYLDQQDTLLAYKDFIAPILTTKCVKCHEEGDARGRLILDTKEGLLSDKYGDPAIKPGDIYHSSIFKRVNLDPSKRKFMPPSGTPLDFYEKKLIEWWIKDGAPFDKNLRSVEVPKDIVTLLGEVYNVDLKPKSFYERAKVPPLSDEIVQQLKENDFNVFGLAANNNFIEVSRVGQSAELTKAQLEALLPAKEHITWLDLSKTNLNDDLMSVLTQFENLTKLKIQNTEITDAGLNHITNMKQLNILNLYGTQISDKAIDQIANLTKLNKLYVWQTNMTDEGKEKLKGLLPNVDIVGGVN